MKLSSPKPSDIRPISVTEARQLRHAILRPHQQPKELTFRGDDDADVLHVGAFQRSKLVGIASVAREELPGEPHLNAWRLRGMATLPAARRKGYGAAATLSGATGARPRCRSIVRSAFASTAASSTCR